MFCPNCGKQLSDHAKFCTACGYAVKNNPPGSPSKTVPDSEEIPAPPVQPEASERNIKQPAPERKKAVPSSGFVQPQIGENVQTAPNKKKRPLLLFAVIAVVVITGLVAIKPLITAESGMADMAESGIVDTVESETADTAEPLAAADQPSEADAADDSRKRAEAYSEVISALQQVYGVGSYTQNGEPSGLVVVREVDFDKDGIPELLCAFQSPFDFGDGDWTFESPYCDGTNCSKCYEVWGWQDGQAVCLVHAPLLGLMAVEDFQVNLLDLDTGVYMLQQTGHIYTGLSIVSTIQNQKWEEIVHLYCNNYSSIDIDEPGAFEYSNLGKQITEEEYQTVQNKWFDYEDSRLETIPIWYGNAQLQQTCLTIQRLNGNAG